MSKQEEERQIVHVKCRRGNDKMTEGQSCPSKRAYNNSKPGSHVASFQCVECRFTWTVATGGAFNI